MSPLRAALVALFLLLPPALSAATFTVTSSNDSGPGTLRQAVLDANANPGLDQIRFTVTDVLLATDLGPAITDPVDIEGPVRVDYVGLFGGRIFWFTAGSSGSVLRNVTLVSSTVLVEIDPGVTGVTVDRTFCQLICAISVHGNANVLVDNNHINLVRLTGDANQLLRNTIGQVHLLFGDNNQIGTAGNGNTINSIDNESAAGTIIAGNTLTGSSTGIPIDLGRDGVTPNDPAPDADAGANNLQNFPVLTSAVLTGSSLVVQGTLASAPLTIIASSCSRMPPPIPRRARCWDRSR
jgi:hypothetical protein